MLQREDMKHGAIIQIDDCLVSEEILTEGSLEWLESDRLIAFTRTLGDRTLLIAVNPSPKTVEEEFPVAAVRVTGPEFLLVGSCEVGLETEVDFSVFREREVDACETSARVATLLVLHPIQHHL